MYPNSLYDSMPEGHYTIGPAKQDGRVSFDPNRC